MLNILTHSVCRAGGIALPADFRIVQPTTPAARIDAEPALANITSRLAGVMHRAVGAALRLSARAAHRGAGLADPHHPATV